MLLPGLPGLPGLTTSTSSSPLPRASSSGESNTVRISRVVRPSSTSSTTTSSSTLLVSSPMVAENLTSMTTLVSPTSPSPCSAGVRGCEGGCGTWSSILAWTLPVAGETLSMAVPAPSPSRRPENISVVRP